MSKFSRFIKFILTYLIFFYALAGIMFFGLKYHYKQSFSQEKLETMMVTQSKWRGSTDDLCNFQIYGDPVDAGKKYVKINFECPDGRSSKNTLSLFAIKGYTYEDIMTEFARIIGFDPKIVLSADSQWECKIDNLKIKDNQIIVREQATINCQ